jgi:hypothetical protein
MDYNNILNWLGKNLDNQGKVIKDDASQSVDRVQMSDPSLSGPRLPASTPESMAASNQALNSASVIGGIGPSKLAQSTDLMNAVGDAAEAGNADMNMVKATQQPASREVDFAQRAAEQLRQRKLDTLKRYNTNFNK